MLEVVDNLERIEFADAILDSAVQDTGFLANQLDTKLEALFPEEVVSWCDAHVKSPRTGQLYDSRPYQIFPMRVQMNPVVEELDISGPEQFGKSSCWQKPAVHKIRFFPGPKFIMYEEERKAQKINNRRFLPMIKSVPELKKMLDDNPRMAKMGSYEFPNGYLDFDGAGTDKTSQEYCFVYGDETDTWHLPFSRKLAQIKNLEKRMRTYRENGEFSQLVLCSSAKGTEDDSAIHQRLKMSSMHVFHLCCLYCGGAIDTTQIDWKRDDNNRKRGGLRWKVENGVAIPDSIRLHCPECDKKHRESDAKKMAELAVEELGDAGYIAKHPERETHIGCIFGGLSSPDCLRWSTIAKERIELTESNDFEITRTFHNSIRGVAVPTGDERDQEAEADIKSHCADEPITEEDVMCVLGSADTQESPWGWYWIIRAIDKKHNTHLLDCGFAYEKAQLETAFNAKYMGRKVDWAIVDQGGTNADDVKDLAKRYRNIWQYKGNTRQAELWKKSKTQGQIKLLLADAERFQMRLLRLIYDQHDRDNHYWFLPVPDEFKEAPFADDDGDFDYLTNIVNVRDLREGKNSHLRQNWSCRSHERRDYFDCEKMMLVLMAKFKTEIANLVAHNGKRETKKLSDIQKQKRAN